jgi:cysteinyl-tRNA synthetase
VGVRLYSTLSEKKEELVPALQNEVQMYTCGPTVHDFAHIGNFRTFVQQDLLRRYIKYRGYRLRHVMNITDVDDNIITKAAAGGMSIQEYTAAYEQAFLEDMDCLRIQHPEIMPRATEHIEAMVELILKLREKGCTYESEGSTYFRIDRFPAYGRLAHLERSTGPAAERVDTDKYDKENPRDFVLWKARKPGEAYWDTPLGPGRPGWHIECSAMSMQYLGETLDIHCGGADLVFPHHENEIAQSEAVTGKPFVRHWMHCEFLMVGGQKMAKSLGNFYTLRDLLQQGRNPLSIRYLLQSVHYRKQLNFTLEGLEQCSGALQRLSDFVLRIRGVTAGFAENPALSRRTKEARSSFEVELDDDLNISAALAALFEFIREVNVLADHGEIGSVNCGEILSFLADVNQVLDVVDLTDPRLEDSEVERLIQERVQARSSRDYGRADQIRNLLAQRGIALEDTKEGTRWKRLM